MAKGQEILGKITAMLPPPRPHLKQTAVFQPGKTAPNGLQSLRLYLSLRYLEQNWTDLETGKRLIVNLSIADSSKKELAAGIGSLRRGK